MSAAEPVFRCATAARERLDPVAGTAPPATRWLLVEHPGPWPVDAVAGSGITPEVLGPLTQAAGGAGARILLVRRPGRTRPGGPRSWILASAAGATVTGHWSNDAELTAATVALGSDPPPAAGPVEPIVLVCAHGIHDVCCALRGRPVAAALARRWPGRVWEASHVGGDRFAPNVVLLPDGFYYGNLDPVSAERTVAGHLAGTVDATFLRGMARHPPPVQAAVASTHVRFGPLGPHDVAVRRTDHLTPGPGELSRCTVRLAVERLGVELEAEVGGVRRAEAQLTCRAGRETPATEYRVRSLRPVSSG